MGKSDKALTVDPLNQIVPCGPSLSSPTFEYIIPLELHFPGRFNIYFRLDIISVIKNELSPEQWKTLCKGCFDMIVRQGDNIPFYAQLVYHMLLFEVHTEKTKEMWFKLDGRLLRFSLLEFCCVTGLNCNDEVLDLGPPEPVTLKSFLGVDKCDVYQLEEFFLNEPQTSDKKLILAKWLIIEWVLLPQRSGRCVREEYLSLVCDIEKFEHFSWGRVVYLHTIDWLKKVSRANLAQRNDNRPGFSLYGYPLAFQIWMLESMPKIADAVACSFSYDLLDPFSLCWSCKKKDHGIRYSKAKKLFSSTFGTIHSLYAQFLNDPLLLFIDEVDDLVVDSYVSSFVDVDDNDDSSVSARKLRIRFNDMNKEEGQYMITHDSAPPAVTKQNKKGALKIRIVKKQKLQPNTSDNMYDFDVPKSKKLKSNDHVLCIENSKKGVQQHKKVGSKRKEKVPKTNKVTPKDYVLPVDNGKDIYKLRARKVVPPWAKLLFDRVESLANNFPGSSGPNDVSSGEGTEIPKWGMILTEKVFDLENTVKEHSRNLIELSLKVRSCVDKLSDWERSIHGTRVSDKPGSLDADTDNMIIGVLSELKDQCDLVRNGNSEVGDVNKGVDGSDGVNALSELKYQGDPMRCENSKVGDVNKDVDGYVGVDGDDIVMAEKVAFVEGDVVETCEPAGFILSCSVGPSEVVLSGLVDPSKPLEAEGVVELSGGGVSGAYEPEAEAKLVGTSEGLGDEGVVKSVGPSVCVDVDPCTIADSIVEVGNEIYVDNTVEGVVKSVGPSVCVDVDPCTIADSIVEVGNEIYVDNTVDIITREVGWVVDSTIEVGNEVLVANTVGVFTGEVGGVVDNTVEDKKEVVESTIHVATGEVEGVDDSTVEVVKEVFDSTVHVATGEVKGVDDSTVDPGRKPCDSVLGFMDALIDTYEHGDGDVLFDGSTGV